MAQRLFPVMLLGLTILAYGLLLPEMGFYWDDWPWVWLEHMQGAGGLLKIDALHRPLAGELLWLGAQLAGESPIRWQVLNLIYRWLSALALWWALGRLWPRWAGRPVRIAILFLVYPGFTQQFVSINSSRHVLPMAFFFLSLGGMVWAVREKRRYLLLTAFSTVCALIAMLTTEYYYGLELLRPAVLWFALAGEEGGFKVRLRKTLLHWLPYLGLFLAVLVWRYFVSLVANYPVTMTKSLQSDPLETLRYSLVPIWNNIILAVYAAWAQALDFPVAQVFGQRKTLFYWILVVGSAAALFVYLRVSREDGEEKAGTQAVVLGLLALVVGGLPFLAADIPIKMAFPSDRGLLPLTFGASLFLVGVLEVAGRRRWIQVGLLSLAVGFATGWQYQNAVSYQRDWNYQIAFFRQLTWRVPAMRPGTSVFALELPNSYSTDDSLTAPLNWIYAADAPAQGLPYMLVYLDLRLGTKVPALRPGLAVSSTYLGYEFQGNTQDALVIHYEPPACLHILHPGYDTHYPQLPELLAEALPLADLRAIQAGAPRSAELLVELFGAEPEPGWCYYFQKSDLARQMGDYEQVAAIGDIAFNLDDAPNHASERVPFIQGYAFIGNWDRARELTFEAMRINKFMQPMLCSLWSDIEQGTPDSVEKNQTIQSVDDKLGCVAGQE